MAPGTLTSSLLSSSKSRDIGVNPVLGDEGALGFCPGAILVAGLNPNREIIWRLLDSATHNSLLSLVVYTSKRSGKWDHATNAPKIIKFRTNLN